jgi:hypothetical protein
MSGLHVRLLRPEIGALNVQKGKKRNPTRRLVLLSLLTNAGSDKCRLPITKIISWGKLVRGCVWLSYED